MQARAGAAKQWGSCRSRFMAQKLGGTDKQQHGLLPSRPCTQASFTA